MTYELCEDLISTDVGYHQLRLIIEHLLKVWNMPVFIRGVTVKALHNNSSMHDHKTGSCELHVTVVNIVIIIISHCHYCYYNLHFTKINPNIKYNAISQKQQ